MRTNGWFRAIALSLVFTGAVWAEGDDSASKDSESAPKLSSPDEMLNRDSCGCNDVACCCDPLPGACWYAGAEFSFLHVKARNGGIMTASFSDTTAPGVSTVAFRQPGGEEDWGSAGRVWVGREQFSGGMPMIDSNSAGRQFMKCWNLKGVGAGAGQGPLKGFYRDGYNDVVFDFSALPDGSLDVTSAGKTMAKSYRSDGFKIFAYGLKRSAGDPDAVNVRGTDHFMIVAIYDNQGPSGVINYTGFSFERGNSDLEYQMVMSTSMSSPHDASLAKFPAARGRMMIGDCMPTY